MYGNALYAASLGEAMGRPWSYCSTKAPISTPRMGFTAARCRRHVGRPRECHRANRFPHYMEKQHNASSSNHLWKISWTQPISGFAICTCPASAVYGQASCILPLLFSALSLSCGPTYKSPVPRAFDQHQRWPPCTQQDHTRFLLDRE